MLAILVIALLASSSGATASIAEEEVVGVDGTSLTIAGANATAPFVGVDDTTLVVYAVQAHVNGYGGYWGANQNFPGPDGSEGDLVCEDLIGLFHQYFWLCHHYNLSLVRTGACDDWGTAILFEAERDHPTEFYEVLEALLHEAAEHDVYVELTLAGSQEWPLYDFGGSGHAFTVGSEDWSIYLDYVNDTIAAVDAMDDAQALFAYDLWNEPDHNNCNTGYWASDQVKFREWAENLSAIICPTTAHIVDIGAGGFGGAGTLWPSWTYDVFWNQTGATGFDICHRHYYASAEDEYLVTDPLGWADDVGKPMLWGELARNDVYPLVRWTWFEGVLEAEGGDAWCNMVLRGTTDYPFEGTIPADEEGEDEEEHEYPDEDPSSDDDAEPAATSGGGRTGGGRTIGSSSGKLKWLAYASAGIVGLFALAAILPPGRGGSKKKPSTVRARSSKPVKRRRR